MPEEFQNLNIVISGVEDTGAQIKIRDQNKRTYSFFKNKKDGGQTVASQDFQKFKLGDTALISYKEVPYKDGVIRNVVGFKPATGAPEAPPSRQGLARGDRPSREYWEQREARRQNSIILQVAFKSAVALEAAAVRGGKDMNRDRLYQNSWEFYDWIADQLGDGVRDEAPGNSEPEDESQGEEI